MSTAPGASSWRERLKGLDARPFFGNPRQAERIIGAGADHYLTKPLQVPALLRVLDNALKGARP